MGIVLTRGICVNHMGRCSMFEKPVPAVEGDRCSECGQLLCHESGVAWADVVLPPEVVLLRMIGGPHPGDRHGPVDELGGWPLPDRLDSPLGGGFYRKVSESQLPAEVAAHPNLMRGAQYEWVPEDE